MTSEELLAQLQTLIYSPNPEHQNIDLNQRLPNGRTVIDEFVRTNDTMQIANILNAIGQQCGAGKKISIDFQAENTEGHSLFKEIMDKAKFDFNAGMIVHSLKEIHNKSDNIIDFNAKVFQEENTLPLELARLGVDQAVQSCIDARDRSGIPLFLLNATNDGNTRVIDYYQERIQNEAPMPEVAMGAAPMNPAFQRDQMLQNVRQLRIAGSVEPETPFVPMMRKLDTDNVHAKVNEEIVQTTLQRLHTTYPDLNVDAEIQDLNRRILEDKTLPPESLANAQFKFNDYADSLNDMADHGTVWSFKKELAYFWREAKASSNEAGLLGTLSDREGMMGCPWGQLVNLCNTAQSGESLDLRDVAKRSNTVVIKRILDQHRQEFANADKGQALSELLDYISTNSGERAAEIQQNLKGLMSADPQAKGDLAWNFGDDITKLWQKCKANSRQQEFMETMSSLDSDAYAQLLKMAAIVELPSKTQRKLALDFDNIMGKEDIQIDIADQVYDKLRMRIQDGEVLQGVVSKWAEGQSNSSTTQEHSLERQLVDGVFNEVLLDTVRKQNGNEIVYSADIKRWDNIVNGIASGIHEEWFDGTRLANIPKSLAAESLINNPDIMMSFSKSLERYNGEHGTLDLMQRGQDGRPMIFSLIDRIGAMPSLQQEEFVRDITNPTKVKVDWLVQDPRMAPPIANGLAAAMPDASALQRLYDVCLPHIRGELMPTIVYAVNSHNVDKANIRLNLYGSPEHQGILQSALDGNLVLSEYKKSVEATKFVRNIDMNNFAEVLAQHEGILDLTQKGLDGRPLFFTLMDKVVGTDHIEQFIKVLSDPSKVKVDWLAQDPASIDGTLQMLYNRCYWHQNPDIKDSIMAIMVDALSDPSADKANIRLNLYQSPEHQPLIDGLISGAIKISGEEYKQARSHELLLSSVGTPGFEQALEGHKGAWDLSQNGSDGRPMIFTLLDRHVIGANFDDILNNLLLNNPKIKVDWGAKDGAGQTALEKLYLAVDQHQPGSGIHMVAQVLLQIDVDHSKLKSFWKAIGNRNLEDLITLQDMVGVPPSSRSTSGRSSPADLDGVLDVIKDLRKVVPQRPRSHSVDEESSLKQVVKDLKESSFKRTGSVDDVRKKPRDDVKRGEGIWKT